MGRFSREDFLRIVKRNYREVNEYGQVTYKLKVAVKSLMDDLDAYNLNIDDFFDLAYQHNICFHVPGPLFGHNKKEFKLYKKKLHSRFVKAGLTPLKNEDINFILNYVKFVKVEQFMDFDLGCIWYVIAYGLINYRNGLEAYGRVCRETGRQVEESKVGSAESVDPMQNFSWGTAPAM
jgi:hypothetical protein